MAYGPIDRGTLARSVSLRPLAQNLNATPAQVVLAWLVARGDTIAIPKAVQEQHLRDNLAAAAAAAALALDAAALAELDVLFPPPRGKQALATSWAAGHSEGVVDQVAVGICELGALGRAPRYFQR